MKIELNEFQRLLPLPMALITTTNAEGVANAAPYSCIMPVLRPLKLVALSSALPRHTLANIRENEEFIINVMGEEEFRKSMGCAEDFPEGVNELEEVGLETSPAEKVKPPRIKEAIGWIEAKLRREIVAGEDEDEEYVIVLGEVISVEVNDKYIENGQPTAHPVAISFLEFKSLGESI